MAEHLFGAFKTPIGTPSAIERIELIPGGGGDYEISADGRLVFSKKASGRFPEDEEVVDALRALI